MGFIRMSDGMANNTAARFMGLNQSATATTTLNNTLGRGMLCQHGSLINEVGGRFAIMKGSVPSDFSTLTSFNVRSADALIVFDASPGTSSTGTNAFQPSFTTENPFTLTTMFVNAIASGTATWFWWFTSPLSGTNTWNNSIAPYNQIVGTVGITGSGADLTLPSVTLVSGTPYRIFHYSLAIPTSWTF